MDFNEQQEALFTWAAEQEGSCNLIARAGTGKTTTIIELAKRISGSVFLGAFNKAIAEELKTRIQRRNVEAGTMHSLGFKLWRGIAKGRTEIDGKKVSGIVKRFGLFDFEKETRNMLISAVGFAKQGGFGLPQGPSHMTHEAWTELFDYHDFWDELPGSISPERILNACVKVYAESLRMCQEQDPLIDFDDMILAPLMFGAPKGMYDWVMIDEAQDTNMVRRLLAQWVLKPGGRMVAVGDPCQPTGTLVFVVMKKGHGRHKQSIVNVPIEKLKVGDKVVSYSQSDCAFVMGRTVLGITKKPFKGRLIGVLTESGKTSEYTPNHHCLVNFSSLRKHHCVYLMRKDDRYRVGSAKMDYGSIGGGPLVRMRSEEADAVWILKTFHTKQEAYVYENVVAANFGLPQLMFTTKNNSTLVQESLDHIWARINPNGGAAVRCLMAHGRELAYPLVVSGYRYTSLKRPMIVRACNILPGCMMLPYKTGVHVHRKDWETVEVYEREYRGDVFSLTVEGEHLYCADGIITHNCQAIYGFAGANHDSMDQIKEAMGSIELPLSITYRCPKSIVAKAQTLVPDIQAHDSAPEGIDRTINHTAFWKEDFQETDVILCRNTRPLIGVAKRLRKMGIPCAVEGANAKALVALASKWGEDITIGQMEEKLAVYVRTQVEKWEGKNRLDKSEAIQERQECLLDISNELEEFEPVSALVKHIEQMYGERWGEDNRRILRLCTVHRAKGREWARVFLIGRNIYMPSRWAKKEWELGQEDNLVYVAWTRVKRELVEVNCKMKKSAEEPDWWEL